MDNRTEKLVNASVRLAEDADSLSFGGKAAFVYNPLVYAAEPHLDYVRKFGRGPKKVLFLGMNPGPWGMAQTGVPFGEIGYVKGWLGIRGPVFQPADPHPKRPVTGWDCERSEVSGRRLWGLIESKFGKPELFFKDHYIENYCPLVFMEESGKNLTPDKLPVEERNPLTEICDRHLAQVIEILEPEFLVGIGKYAEKSLKRVASGTADPGKYTISSVLHPSPASPMANRGWAETAEKQLKEQGIW